METFLNIASFLKVFCLTCDCWTLPKGEKMMCYYFSLIIALWGSSCTSVSWCAETWHAPLKLSTYTQVRICDLIYFAAFNENCVKHKQKEKIYPAKEVHKTLCSTRYNQNPKIFSKWLLGPCIEVLYKGFQEPKHGWFLQETNHEGVK